MVSHETGYYSAITKNKELINATTWMNFKNVLKKEANHQRPNIVLYYFIYMKHPKMENPYKQKAHCWLRGDREQLLNGHRNSLLSDENISELDGSGGSTML